MKNIFCFTLALLLSLDAICGTTDTIPKKKHYHVNYVVSSVIIAGGLASDAFAITRIKNKPWLTDEELLFVNSDAQKSLINPIDRWALRQKASDRMLYKHISDYSLGPIILIPAFLLFDKSIRKDWFDLLLIYTEGHTVTFTFYNYSFLGPTFHNRYRPMTYYSEFTDDDRKSGNNRNSFYSGHVASTAYSTFFMAKVYCDYHPDLGGTKWLIYLAASVPPVLMSYARIKALDHFPSDDAVGFLLGATLGIIIPELHKYPCSKFVSLGMFTSPDAVGLSIHLKLPPHNLLSSLK